MRARRLCLLVTAALVVVACAGDDDELPFTDDTSAPTAAPTSAPSSASAPTSGAGSSPPDADVVVTLDPSAAGDEISPLIRGVSGDLDAAQMREAGIAFNSWGGNPSTRFNYEIGHAWNTAADFEFRNTDYENEGDAARFFLDLGLETGAETRLAVPTLGWIAANDDIDVCSFPDDDGGCTGGEGANCQSGGPVADPERTSVRSTPEMAARWIESLVAEGRAPRFIAMDNEPELWGFTHYDVHPECTTFEEIRDRYLAHAVAIREVAPDAELMGPVACCWFDYWNIDPGPADGPDEDFISWFLREVREHDEQYGQRTLDVLDVHYYPQSGVYNDEVDPESAAKRLRSTRSLWDPSYVDESWIGKPIRFIPRMKELAEAAYPGTPLAISEWNFGADGDINGALAIADVLGIYGREGVYAASYWRSPAPGSPGYRAFQLFGNYDGQGSSFSGRTIPAESSDPARLRSYAALDETTLRLVLVNQDPAPMSVVLEGASTTAGRRFTYGVDDLDAIVEATVDASSPVEVPGSSIVVLELPLS